MTAKDRVIAALTTQTGQTAVELGESGVTMNRLVKAGVVYVATTRRSGDRGRPSGVYCLVGQEFDTTADDEAHLYAAQARLDAHRQWERLSNAIMRAANEFGHGSPEHNEAKTLRRETFPILPDTPTPNDYEVTGNAKAVTSLSDLNATDEGDYADLDEQVAV